MKAKNLVAGVATGVLLASGSGLAAFAAPAQQCGDVAALQQAVEEKAGYVKIQEGTLSYAEDALNKVEEGDTEAQERAELNVSIAKSTLTELQVELSALKDNLKAAQECVAGNPEADKKNDAKKADKKADAKKADKKADAKKADKKADAKKGGTKGLPSTGAAGTGLATLGLVAASGAAMVTVYRKRKW